MSAAPDLLADLMAPFVGRLHLVRVAPAANVAIPAKDQQRRGIAADSAGCEGLRRAANLGAPSQAIAGVRNPADRPENEYRRGVSQVSQPSRGVIPARDSAALAALAWTDADMSRFIARRDRLRRWGWADPDAEALAERLVIRDRGGDPRAACVDCDHYRPGRCANHRLAGLGSAEVGRDLAATLQRCAGFRTVDPPPRGGGV